MFAYKQRFRVLSEFLLRNFLVCFGRSHKYSWYKCFGTSWKNRYEDYKSKHCTFIKIRIRKFIYLHAEQKILSNQKAKNQSASKLWCLLGFYIILIVNLYLVIFSSFQNIVFMSRLWRYITFFYFFILLYFFLFSFGRYHIPKQIIFFLYFW